MPKMKWSELSSMQIGRYAEYYAKMEFTSYGYDVYTSEVDDHGVDFVARDVKTDIFYEIQVKSLRKGNYAFIPEKLMDCNDSKRIVCFLKFVDGRLPDAYALNAKYIIHTVGPVWVDGKHEEVETLEKCYVKSLQKALELGCDSIAFPLISTGVYGFPKDKALHIAVSVFSRFLLENEMQIILVVFDKKSFQLSGQLVGEIDSFIDANYIRQKRKSEYSRSPFRRSKIESDITYDSEAYEECCHYTEEEESETELLGAAPMPERAMSLEEELENVGMSFHDKLFELIGKSGMDNKDVWKRANLDRKHFSKIQCDEKYHPKKKTVMALCIALELDLEQANDFVGSSNVLLC